MTNLNIKSIMILLICTFCIFSCEEIEMPQFENANDLIIKNEVTSLNLPIVSRSDEECEMCIDVDACCCLVELQIPLQTTALTLQICGVTPGTNENAGCSMDTGDGCYDVGNRAIQVVLDPNGQTKQYFCISPGTAFSIWNQSVGGSGWVRVGCSSGTIGGTLAFNLPGYPPSGGFVRYFQSDANCDFEICDY